MTGGGGADEVIDGLYALDLDEFVAARDRAARELRTTGDREGAARVKEQRKPSRIAWALNRAVRRAPDALDAVLAAGRALRAAQQEAITSGGGDLHGAARARRQAVRALADVAVDQLGAGGESARERIEQTLHAASIDEESAAAVQSAQLVRELEPPDVFATLDLAPGARAAPTRAGTDENKSERPPVDGRARRRAEEARAAAEEAVAEAERAEAEHDAATARAAELDRLAREAEAAARGARDAAHAAAEQAREARARARDAERAARAADDAAGLSG